MVRHENVWLPENGSGARQAEVTERPAAEETVVHDGVLRVIAFTMVRAGLHSLLAEGAEMRFVLSRLTAWLERERRLVESATGLPLRCAYFVRVSKERRVAEVLCGPQLPSLDHHLKLNQDVELGYVSFMDDMEA